MAVAAGLRIPARGDKADAARRHFAVASPGETGLKHTPYGEQGSGFYTDATRGCFDVLARLTGPVLEACQAMLANRTASQDFSPFRIMDLGTADAGTSLPLVRKCVELIRKTPGFESVPIEVLYEDQPGNDWVSVFARTQGTVATPNVPDEAGGLADFKDVFVLASGTSFYKTCCAPGTVDVAFCATAFHWLTSSPSVIPDALHSACTEDPATLERYRRQADEDWRRIMSARGRELRPGARLVVANFAKDVNGHFLGFSPRTESMHHNFARIWKDMVTPAEFEATNFPNHYRSLEECSAPFGGEGGVFAGLKLLSAETAIVPCPYLDSWLADPTKRTAAEQSKYYVPTTRTWSNSTFVAGLGSHRSAAEKEAMVDAMYNTYAEHVAKDPSKHGMDYVHSYLVVEKQAEGAAGSKRAGVQGSASSGTFGSQVRGVSTSTATTTMSTFERALFTMAEQRLPTADSTACGRPARVLHWPTPHLGADIYIAYAQDTPLSQQLPGNGGLRIWDYASSEDAVKEAIGLAEGMRLKHSVYNTGFAGAKVVVNASTCRDTNQLKIDKKELMSVVGTVLNDLGGTMYTGCDMNSNLDDMDNLMAKSPYVLAGIGNLALDPNDATAYGLLGALEALAQRKFSSLKGTSFFVHGLGNVGKTAAEELVAAGAKVYVYDILPERAAAIDGAVDISDIIADAGPAWAEALPDVDIFVPCSKSNLIDLVAAQTLPVKAICGSTNLPFASKEAEAAFAARGGIFVPESMTSAGAVIADSIEHFDAEGFAKANPQDIYDFTRSTVFSTTMEALDLAADQHSVRDIVPELSSKASAREPVGKAFGMARQARAGGVSGATGFGGPRRGYSSSSSAARRGFSSAASPSTSSTADVVIVGSGIMGMNIAYQMKRRDPALSVTILERASALGFGSSGWSTGFLRAFYSFDNTMELALDGINAYKNWGEYTGLGDKAEAYFTHTGALWMLGKTKEANMAIHERLNKYGVKSEVMDADAISKRFPALSTEPYPEFNAETGDLIEKDYGECWAVYEDGCGHMDSSSCLRDIHQACEREGVNIVFNARVAEVLTNAGGDRAEGVKLMDGSELKAGTVLNCTGPWFQQLNGKVGVKTTTEMLPTRIQVGHKTLPDDEALLSLPFVADYWGNSGIYFMPRRANKQLVFGSIAHRFESETVDPDNFNEALDPDVKQDYMSCLFHRCPTMPHSGHIQGFSHMYTVNQEDVHPVIGASAEMSNYFLCNGFSGHGFKLAPAVGSLVSQQVLGSKTERWETSIPLSFMDPNRKPLALQVKTHFA